MGYHQPQDLFYFYQQTKSDESIDDIVYTGFDSFLLSKAGDRERQKRILKICLLYPRWIEFHWLIWMGKSCDWRTSKENECFLNLWATWCKPCIAEMPDLSNANDALSKEGYVFLAASDESLEKINAFVTKYDFSFQFVKMENSVYDLEVVALPTSLVINAQGELVFDEVGAKDWDSESELQRLRQF